MRVEKQRVTCLDCNHVFMGEFVFDAPIIVATAAMKAIKCPKCHSRKVGIGGASGKAAPIAAPIDVRAAWWMDNGERGISSETIWHAFSGGYRSHADHPHDPDDFRRCRELLTLMPEWRKHISKVAEVHPWMRPFTARWDEMDLLYDLESPTKRCPQLYALIQVASKESWAIRYPEASR